MPRPAETYRKARRARCREARGVWGPNWYYRHEKKKKVRVKAVSPEKQRRL